MLSPTPTMLPVRLSIVCLQPPLILNSADVYKTEYRAEIFYPDYYDAGRPAATGIPATVSYGGAPFDLTLPASSLNNTNLDTVKIALIRTGFSTHAMK